jgi:hypothetical protein
MTSDENEKENGDVPESVSLQKSKEIVRRRDDRLKDFRTQEKEKKKDRNREVDRKRKERVNANVSVSTKGTGGDGVLDRMERAMREAQEEMDEDGDGDGDGGEPDDEDSSEDGEDFHDNEVSSGRLPDHLFVSAFAAQAQASSKRSPASKAHSKHTPNAKRKRKAGSRKAKDVIVG